MIFETDEEMAPAFNRLFTKGQDTRSLRSALLRILERTALDAAIRDAEMSAGTDLRSAINKQTAILDQRLQNAGVKVLTEAE